MKKGLMYLLGGTLLSMAMGACGGGGGGGGGTVLYYPYETVYGTVCSTMEPTPGCTFSRTTGARIDVTQDTHYNRYGTGSDDMWYVKFDSSGNAAVYNDLGVYQYTTGISNFAGWVGGNYIGVGTTGLYWENVTNGTYWLGKNGVLYSGNFLDSNFGKAINEKTASEAVDTNFAALSSETNKELVRRGADKLSKEYGMGQDKARAVASALNSWAVAAAERGHTTEKDMDKTFKAVFGVEFSSALTAFKELQDGDKESMRELTLKTASSLGLKPHQAEKFIKGMYKDALAQFGYNSDDLSWME